MSFLYFLEGIRNSFLDTFMLTATRLGEETFFIIIGMLFFWCIDKYQGYYILSVGFVGTIANQFLKIFCRIPRPWVRDPEFTVVGNAKEAAGGYSFPSGHTQASVGSFGSVARWSKNRTLRIICIIVCVLVPFSRMYLGVHTPADVGVSVIIALALIFGLYPVIRRAQQSRKTMWIFIGVLAAASFAFLLFVEVYNFPADIDKHNYASALKNAYTLSGCIAGLAVVYYIDAYHIRFDTKAVWWAQILKLLGGTVLVFAAKAGLKAPLLALCGGHNIATLIRYFILVVVAGGLWPMTFKWFSRLGRAENKS